MCHSYKMDTSRETFGFNALFNRIANAIHLKLKEPSFKIAIIGLKGTGFERFFFELQQSIEDETV